MYVCTDIFIDVCVCTHILSVYMHIYIYIHTVQYVIDCTHVLCMHMKITENAPKRFWVPSRYFGSPSFDAHVVSYGAPNAHTRNT